MGFRSAPNVPIRSWPAACACLPAFFLIACAPAPVVPTPAEAGTPGVAPGAAAPGPLYSLFHRSLPAPEGRAEVLRLHATGVQIFRCEAQPAGNRWTYRLPQAELVDASGAVAVHHGANLSFEHVDGSRLLGDIVDHVPAPTDNALPWLLLATRSYGKGVLAGVTHVQRIDTLGGMPPPSCEAAALGQILRVPFSADFVFYR